jgi:rubrerythrin
MIFDFNAAEVFQIAIEIEENGKAFYEKAQSVIQDPEVSKLFVDLANEEVQHKKKFESLKAQLPQEASKSTLSDLQNELNLYIKMVADEHVFRTREGVESQLTAVKNAGDALKLAIQFEKDSVIFFLSMQEATDETKGREFINLLVKEEQAHLRRLTLQLQKMNR